MQKRSEQPRARPAPCRAAARGLTALLVALAMVPAAAGDPAVRGAAPPGAGSERTVGPERPSAAEQQPSGEAGPLPSHRETETVRLVLLSTIVTDRRGRPVQRLTQGDFTLFEGGESREIKLFATERDTPVSVAFLLDLSGSMRQQGKLDEAKRMIHAFIESLGPEDRFGLIGFADDQVTWITEFTSDVETFLVRLDVQHGYGSTALFDAIAATPELVDRKVHGRRAIVLFTDGVDTASELSELQAAWTARRVDVPIYTLGFTPMPEEILPRRGRNALRTLDRFSRETGGKLFPIHTPKELRQAIERIQDELRFQYVIGFDPRPGTWDRSFRPIRLKVKGDNLRVQTRKGYYATP